MRRHDRHHHRDADDRRRSRPRTRCRRRTAAATHLGRASSSRSRQTPQPILTFSYTSNSPSYVVGTPVQNAPVVTGGQPTGYTVDTGAPGRPEPQRHHRRHRRDAHHGPAPRPACIVTASNAANSKSVTLSITVTSSAAGAHHDHLRDSHGLLPGRPGHRVRTRPPHRRPADLVVGRPAAARRAHAESHHRRRLRDALHPRRRGQLRGDGVELRRLGARRRSTSP